MRFRYIEINEDWDREEAQYIQSETVEDNYAERIKAIKNCGQVLCKDGLARDVPLIEYFPPNSTKDVPTVEVYLAEV